MPELHIRRILTGDEEVEVLTAAADLARAKAQRWTAILGVTVAVVVILALGTLAFELNVASISRDQADRATKQLIELQRVNLAKNKCALQFEANQRQSSFQYLGNLGELVIVISTVPQTDPTRHDQIQAAVANLKGTLSTFEAATTALNKWVVLPPEAQLPCPLGD